MYLDELIDILEKADQKKVLKLGFRHPHSYRGDYAALAFEPEKNVKVSDMLKCAKRAFGETYRGWKGGEYTMDELTKVYLAEEGNTGDAMSALLLDYMLKDTDEEPTRD